MAHAIIPFPQDAVVLKDGQAVTTSLKVAEVFGKQHKHVLRAIETLECSEEFGRANFGLANYLDKQGKPRPMYNVFRNGLVWLVMGFTGPEAAQYKEAYIRAFDMMEGKLKELQTLPEPRETVTMDKVEADNLKLRVENAEMRLALLTGQTPPRRRNWQTEEVSRLIILTRQGLKSKGIGEKLGRSPDSVETKLRELRAKNIL